VAQILLPDRTLCWYRKFRQTEHSLIVAGLVSTVSSLCAKADPHRPARVMVNGKTVTKSFLRKEDAKAFIVSCKKAKDTGTVAPVEEKDVTWEQAEKNCLEWWKQAVVLKEIKQSTADFYKWQMIPLGAYFQEKTF